MPDIRFSYQALTASTHEVGLAGDFTGWEILEMKDLGGVHVINLPVETGTHRYKFIVDGVWTLDPANPRRESDPFGSENSILIVKAAQELSLSWEEVYEDPSLLQERVLRYLDVIRIDKDRYEIRVNWYPGLECDIEILIGEEVYPAYRLGITGNREVFHRCLEIRGESFSLAARFRRAWQELYYGAMGFVKAEVELIPHRILGSELEQFPIPEWVSKGVIYQIFPERFCNGDAALNPDFSEWYYEDSRQHPAEGEFLPPHVEYFHLVEDWYDTSGLRQNPYLPEGKPDWWSFYGGDIPGVISRLDYLSQLGVSILYFNPLWPAKSNHKYDAADYKSIDHHFGDPVLMRELCDHAHARGMKVILDVAFNHTGETFWAFRDCVEKGAYSRWWNWYDWKRWPLPQPLPADFDPQEYYQCWWGIKNMPDLNFDLSRSHPAENYIRDIKRAIPNHSLIEYLLESVTWWIVEMDIDGFRLDVPDEVPYWFWELFRRHVKTLKPDAWLVGEIWNNAQGWVDRRYFDAVMNYAYFKNPVLDYFIFGHSTAAEFMAKIEEGLAQYPFHACAAMMNLIGSHDTYRIASLAGVKLKELELALVFQMCYLGAPHIYYGDEILMEGGADPDNRRPFNWKWEDDAKAVKHRELIRELIRLRKAWPALQDGEFSWLETEGELVAFERFNTDSRLKVFINASGQKCRVKAAQKAKALFSLGQVAREKGNFLLGQKAALVWAEPVD